MSAEFATTDRISQAQALTTSGANTIVFANGRPMNIKRIVMVVSTAITVTAPIANFGVRNVDDSSSVVMGTITLAIAPLNAVLSADIAQSYAAPQVYDTWGISQPATVTTGRVVGVQTSLPGQVQCDPGQEFFITITTTSTAGAVAAYIEYQDEGNNPTRFAPTAMAVTRA